MSLSLIVPLYAFQHEMKSDLYFANTGGGFNIKMSSYQYRYPHVKDKTVSRPSYLKQENPHTWARRSSYWDGAQILIYSTRLPTWPIAWSDDDKSMIKIAQNMNSQRTLHGVPLWVFHRNNYRVTRRFDCVIHPRQKLSARCLADRPDRGQTAMDIFQYVSWNIHDDVIKWKKNSA